MHQITAYPQVSGALLIRGAARQFASAAYLVNMRRGQYEAERRDDGTVLTADSADALLGLIRADYASRPVPRSAGTAAPDPRPCRFLPGG